MTIASAIEVFIVDLIGSRDLIEAEERQTPCLSADDVRRFEQKSAALGIDNARSWRAAHVALRIILERYTGPALRGMAFDRTTGGKRRVPQLLNLARSLEFSLAHADSVALIAISEHDSVGADIEVPRIIRMTDERRHRIVVAASRLAPDIALPDGSDARLLQSWVRLEALAKATGLGIGRILTQAGIVGAKTSDANDAERSYSVNVIDLALGADLYGAVAAPRLSPPIAVRAFPGDAAALAAFKTSGA